ncbi:hypothetical protein K1W69_19360 [Hoeflea sp. WL0058]|uniref:Uncharacterized protein n=1 Tax=Flavimaribacter sediminis TaxID=2865987 RepID=A0AAE2ZR03_9HYPH|nr:hypothetical protein [Flavimaribacter sediminis]MBW8639361.1 hypothetical protein [Flavimaribacter sediminis]
MLRILAVLLACMVLSAQFVSLANSQNGIHRLGHRWDVTVPGGWKGIWTRRDISGGISNIYDAAWHHPTHGSIRSELRIHIDVRDGLIIERWDINGPQAGRKCTYKGSLNYPRRTAGGTFGCAWAPGPYNWRATIWR